jgi:hypothetical protein
MAWIGIVRAPPKGALMTHRARHVLAGLLALSLAACGAASGPRSPDPIPVTVEFPGGLPDWLAFQSGEGAWALVSPVTASITRNVVDAQGRYAWLYGTTDGVVRMVGYFPSTAAEEPVMRLSVASAPKITVTGNVTGLLPGETAMPFFNDSINLSGGGAEAIAATSTSGYSFTASPGSADLIFVTNQGLRLARFNDIDLSVSQALPDIDLSSAAPVGTVLVTAAGVEPTDDVYGFTDLRTANRTQVSLGWAYSQGLPVPLQVASLPDSAWRTGDLMTVGLDVSDYFGTTYRSSDLVVAGPPGPVTLLLPARTSGLFDWTTYEVAPRFQYGQVPAATYYSIMVIQWTATNTLAFYSVPSAARFTSAVQPIPDFGVISGMPATWGWIGTSPPVGWDIGAYGTNVQLGPSFSFPPAAAGDTHWSTEVSGSMPYSPAHIAAVAGTLPAARSVGSPSTAHRKPHARSSSSGRTEALLNR